MAQSTDSNLPVSSATMTYELDVARDVSTDFLAEARGAIYQAEIEALAKDFRADGYNIGITHRLDAGAVSLVLSAQDPESLHAVSAAADEIGYELPEPEARPGHTPEQVDGVRANRRGLIMDPAPSVPDARKLTGHYGASVQGVGDKRRIRANNPEWSRAERG